jgi:hypothetical protein
LVGQLRAARLDVLTAFNSLPPAAKNGLPICGSWTAKEVLAHLSGWTAWDCARIREVLAGAQPSWHEIADIDTFNDGLVARRKEWSTPSILAEMRIGHLALESLIAGISDEDTFGSAKYFGPYWRDLAGWLRVAWEHERDHAVQFRQWHARRARQRRPELGQQSPP